MPKIRLQGPEEWRDLLHEKFEKAREPQYTVHPWQVARLMVLAFKDNDTVRRRVLGWLMKQDGEFSSKALTTKETYVLASMLRDPNGDGLDIQARYVLLKIAEKIEKGRVRMADAEK